jgi:energy-coupling factor transporter ATP-binding protein EcfA2
MIKIESVHIEEFRGIRQLTLEMNRGSFVISGPNGSGKSGVVDAIQFALTGEIGRLKGAGTGDLKLVDHGPHVVKRDYPDAAFVRLTVFIPRLNKSATITRKIKNPRRASIVPNDEDIKAVFAELEDHPEITLSRREIIKFILSEATQRSRDVQTLLKLEQIDQTRAVLKTVENRLDTAVATARNQEQSSKESLKRHLDIAELTTSLVLEVVNRYRRLLGLSELTELTKETSLSSGIEAETEKPDGTYAKESMLKDINTLLSILDRSSESPADVAVDTILKCIGDFEAEPELWSLVKKQSLFQSGLDLLDDAMCPLCDTPWELATLRAHLNNKIARSLRAKEAQELLLRSARSVATQVSRVLALASTIAKFKVASPETVSVLMAWAGRLQGFGEQLSTMDGLVASKTVFEHGWRQAPETIVQVLDVLVDAVKRLPEKSELGKARDFLVVAQERLSNWRIARRRVEQDELVAKRGTAAYKAYTAVSESMLTKLYEEVEDDFSSFYQVLNNDDEGAFSAKFEPADGKLGLVVDFHSQGMFPPGAYHSEGHQDGMGVCLYLALMKRVLANQFTIAVLDDVVMSVDSQHRKRFCKLLKSAFPNTQFVITTHDQVWAKQIRTEGVVGSKSGVAFNTWTVQTGPVVEEVKEIWDQIEKSLLVDDIPAAAAKLRRHMEFVAAELADILGASVPYRGDGGYDLGELLGAVIGKQGELLKRGLKAARSWDDQIEIERISGLQKERSELTANKDGEQWAINKAVHYNSWADLTKEDFLPVVTAFKQLLLQFRCDKPKCNSWLSPNSRMSPTELRCSCGTLRINLNEKK